MTTIVQAVETGTAGSLLARFRTLGIAVDVESAGSISVPIIRAIFEVESARALIPVTVIIPVIFRAKEAESALSLTPIALHTPAIDESLEVSEIIAKKIIKAIQDTVSVTEDFDPVGGSLPELDAFVSTSSVTENITIHIQDYFLEDYTEDYTGTTYNL